MIKFEKCSINYDIKNRKTGTGIENANNEYLIYPKMKYPDGRRFDGNSRFKLHWCRRLNDFWFEW